MLHENVSVEKTAKEHQASPAQKENAKGKRRPSAHTYGYNPRDFRLRLKVAIADMMTRGGRELSGRTDLARGAAAALLTERAEG